MFVMFLSTVVAITVGVVKLKAPRVTKPGLKSWLLQLSSLVPGLMTGDNELALCSVKRSGLSLELQKGILLVVDPLTDSL